MHIAPAMPKFAPAYVGEFGPAICRVDGGITEDQMETTGGDSKPDWECRYCDALVDGEIYTCETCGAPKKKGEKKDINLETY